MRNLFWAVLVFLSLPAFAESKVLNVYSWTGEIPEFVIRQFEKETGIKVNFSTYENNEIMYAKLRAEKNSGYDIVLPSSYFVDRMRKQDMLEKLDKSQIANYKNLDSHFLNPAYDPQSEYGIPHIWGITGIFVNQQFYDKKNYTKWTNLWDDNLKNQLMLIDDMREVFSMALLSLGFSPNDNNPQHIQAAFEKLKTLMQNVKVFSSDTLISIMVDEDATIGMAWNGDAYKANSENPQVNFIFPQEGFVIWVDNFVIPKQAPHKKEAYQFLNFMLRADVAKSVALAIHFPTANAAGRDLLPADIKNNPIIYPAKDIMKKGYFQTDLDPSTLAIYEKYWEELKVI